METEDRSLRTAAWISLAVHGVAGAAMALVLWRGLATNPDLADRVAFLDEHRALWRAAWATWNVAALSILWFYRCFARRESTSPLAAWVLPLTLVAVTADLSAEAIYMGVVPGLPADALLVWDRRAVLLTGFFANGLYTGVAGLLAWIARARYARWVGAAAAAVVVAGAGLSAAAFFGSVPGLFWTNALLVPAIVAWQLGVIFGSRIQHRARPVI